MRCPKCAYISFDTGERCRNCGYDFSLADEATASLDPPVRDTAEGPLVDLVLPQKSTGDTGRIDLPLFGDQASSDVAPLVQPTPAPRAPLSVRRRTPDIVKARTTVRSHRDSSPTLDLGSNASTHTDTTGAVGAGPTWEVAGLARRMTAGLIDVLVLGLVGVAVLYFTLRLTGLSPQQAGSLPTAPLAAFLLLVYGGYFLAFTMAGGQTIGKMATHIRVVGAGSIQVSPQAACARTAGSVLSLLAIGLGYVVAIADGERRAWHDRLAATRVVKVS